jgi:hypothetical protein
MLLVVVVAGCAVLALLALLARRMWVGWRRWEAQACVTEEEARDHAAPLTTAIISDSDERGRSSAAEHGPGDEES